MKIYIIGIGGIGVSSLAQYYLAKGHEVLGSDLVASEITEMLKEKGAKIATGTQMGESIKEGIELIVYSPAVPADNLEYKKAKELGIALQSYPEALGELTRHYFTIAVSGAHGKSTTTAMIGLILAKAHLDPTVIVGTKLKEFGDSNFRMGKSNFLVIEACEYDASFINYSPKIVVVTNIDKEHMDYFKTFANVLTTFKHFILKLPEDGFLVANNDDVNTKKVSLGKPIFTTVYFSKKQKEAKKLKKLLKIPGLHNVQNALAALSVARILEVKDEISLKSLSEYRGSWRRFEIKETEIDGKKITVISDYGHHPTEILATLSSAREKYPDKKIWCIFQPHQYQRTHYLLNDFVKVFKKVKIDHIIITDIYDVAGREVQDITNDIDSEKLVKKIGKEYVQYMSLDIAEAYVKEHIKRGEVLIIMGAGDVYKLVEKF